MKVVLIFLISICGFTKVGADIKNFNWNGVEVVWLESSKFPKFDVVVYLSDGALADTSTKEGLTSTMFDLLSSGTSKYNQKTLSDKFDFYGSGIGSNVTHEYSSLNFSGLVKDAPILTDLFCHVIRGASFPDDEISSFKKRSLSQLKNLVANHRGLANRIFRHESLKGTPFSSFTRGTIGSINKMTKADLVNSKNYFNDKVYKKIFISGPKEVLKIEGIFKNKCKWSKVAKFKRKDQRVSISRAAKMGEKGKLDVIFAPVKGANQAQIRLGNFVPTAFFSGKNFDLTKLTSSILGGGFTSLLMQELRVKRGLTYGAYAQAAPQALYGRSILQTSTKNETLLEALYTIRDTLKFFNSNSLPSERVEGVKKFLKGKHLLQFESNSSFIGNLVLFDHLGKSYSDLHAFSKNLDGFTKAQVINQGSKLFSWTDQVIFILGDPSLKSQLEKSKLFSIKEVQVDKYL